MGDVDFLLFSFIDNPYQVGVINSMQRDKYFIAY
jgi:hypothetical protein